MSWHGVRFRIGGLVSAVALLVVAVVVSDVGRRGSVLPPDEGDAAVVPEPVRLVGARSAPPGGQAQVGSVLVVGRVLARGARQPIAHALVAHGSSSTRAGGDGRFALHVESMERSAALRVSAPGWEPAKRLLTASRAGRLDLGDVLLEGAGSLTVVVRDPRREPVAGASVTWLLAEAPRLLSGPSLQKPKDQHAARTGPDGHAVLREVPVGPSLFFDVRGAEGGAAS